MFVWSEPQGQTAPRKHLLSIELSTSSLAWRKTFPKMHFPSVRLIMTSLQWRALKWRCVCEGSSLPPACLWRFVSPPGVCGRVWDAGKSWVPPDLLSVFISFVFSWPLKTVQWVLPPFVINWNDGRLLGGKNPADSVNEREVVAASGELLQNWEF